MAKGFLVNIAEFIVRQSMFLSPPSPCSYMVTSLSYCYPRNGKSWAQNYYLNHTGPHVSHIVFLVTSVRRQLCVCDPHKI